MTAKQLVLLTAPQLADAFALHSTTVNGQPVRVSIEKSLIPTDADPAELAAWLQSNATDAIMGNEDGIDRVNGGTLGGQWSWLYRIHHNSGGVTLLEAEGNA